MQLLSPSLSQKVLPMREMGKFLVILGVVIVLLGLGAAIAFLIKIEMGRMLASPTRRQ